MGGFDFAVIRDSLPFVWQGFLFSAGLTLFATICGLAFGTLLALARLSGYRWLSLPATVYVNAMRSIPLVMVILWFFLALPLLTGKPVGAERSAFITFAAFEAAYFSEILRAGIRAFRVDNYRLRRRWGWRRCRPSVTSSARRRSGRCFPSCSRR